jgi:hypothetical protein
LKADEYNLGSIGQWPTFTQTTKSLDQAALYSEQFHPHKGEKGSDEILIFEIFLNNKNETATHIDLSKGDGNF